MPVGRDHALREATGRLLEQVRLQRRADAIAGELSYSEQRSLEIAMTLAADPKVILLDEPMAGMSKEETDYTAGLIRELTRGRPHGVIVRERPALGRLQHQVFRGRDAPVTIQDRHRVTRPFSERPISERMRRLTM